MDALNADGSIILRPEPSNPTRSLIEDKPGVPSNDLMAYIIANTGGKASPYIFTPTKTSTPYQGLPPAPEGTHRVSMVVDGVSYAPLAASCPAVSCTNGDPIAAAVPDSETRAYTDAVTRYEEKKQAFVSGFFSFGGAAFRGLDTILDLANGVKGAKSIIPLVNLQSADANSWAFPTWTSTGTGAYSPRLTEIIDLETGLPRITISDLWPGVSSDSVAAGSVKNVNPSGSMLNCSNCVYVVDNQLTTGTQASALPMLKPLPFNQLNSTFNTQMSGWTTRTQMEKTLLGSGNGTSAVVYGMDANATSAHVWNAVVQNGKVNYIDGQIGGGGAGNFKDFPNIRFGIIGGKK